MTARIRILVADALPLYAEALTMALHWFPELELEDEYPTTGEGLIEAVARLKPDVALVDYWLPDMDGASAAAEMGRRSPDTKTLVLSWFYGPDQIKLSLDAGAVGFLTKSISVGQLREAILQAHAGESPVYEDQLRRLVDKVTDRTRQVADIRDRLKSLTPRELELLRHLSYGHSIGEIAKDLSIAQATVRDHFHNIVTKTGARTKEQALAMARYSGLITG